MDYGLVDAALGARRRSLLRSISPVYIVLSRLRQLVVVGAVAFLLF